ARDIGNERDEPRGRIERRKEDGEGNSREKWQWIYTRRRWGDAKAAGRQARCLTRRGRIHFRMQMHRPAMENRASSGMTKEEEKDEGRAGYSDGFIHEVELAGFA